jgi:hypothetical protein
VKPPREVLLSFIKAMHDWENEAWEASRRARNEADPAAYIAHVQQRMNDIFTEYCTAKKRSYGRLGSFQHPPEYDPGTEQILQVVEESPRRVLIHTQQQTGFGNHCQYVLIKQRGEWRIDNRRIVHDDGSTVPNVL